MSWEYLVVPEDMDVLKKEVGHILKRYRRQLEGESQRPNLRKLNNEINNDYDRL